MLLVLMLFVGDSVNTNAVLFVGLLSGELLIYAVDHSRLLRGLDDSADLYDEYDMGGSGDLQQHGSQPTEEMRPAP